MMKALTISVLVICFLLKTGESSKCDVHIINMIRARFWNHGLCTPKELLRSGAYTSPGITIRTSKDFYPDEEKISCVYTVFEGPIVKLYTQYVNSTSAQGPTLLIRNTEQDGVLIDEERGDYMYYLYGNRYGVRAFYKCTKTGKSGDPEGLIKITADEYNKDSLAQSVKDLASLGIRMSDKVFGDSCVPKKKFMQ